MAAGISERCGFDKLTAQLRQQTVLETTLAVFQGSRAIDDIWIVGVKTPLAKKIKGVIEGGPSRFQSVKAGLEHCQNYYEEDVRIWVHNAANPFLKRSDLEAGLKAAETKSNLVFGFFTPNAIKQVSKEGIVSSFLDREQIFESQTPQISTLSTFEKALDTFRVRTQSVKQITESGLVSAPEPKDEAELLALTGEAIHIFECDPSNIKITYANDFKLNAGLRLGFGEDSHRFSHHFEPKKPFRLGGVDVSQNELSSDGNSDGDVIIHSLCNALLSAFGEKTFDPIAAPICAAGETNSTAYLQATLDYLADQGHTFQIQKILISLEGAQPKIAPMHDIIIKNLAGLLSLQSSRIGFTYTSGESLTDFGKGLGMRSYCLVTLRDD